MKPDTLMLLGLVAALFVLIWWLGFSKRNDHKHDH